jgi:hypothetical protein
MTDNPAAARFPAVPLPAGHYESFYLKLADPARPRGAWIRYTVRKRPGHPPLGSVWCTVWPGDGAAPEARKLTFEDLGADELIRVGGNRLGPGQAAGALDDAAWQLTYAHGAAPFAYLPRGWMYRAPIPRTKAVSLSPRATFGGEVTIGGHRISVDGWPGMVGHNWGSEHAERWIWLHGTGFEGAPGAWLDVIIGRVRLGPVTLPWIANGGLWLDGRLHRLGGPAAIRATSVIEEPGGCRFSLPGVTGRVEAPEGATVAWEYRDPSGGRHFACNCSVSAMTLTALGRSLHLPAGAAFEHGSREPPGAIPVQPHPDL